MINYYQTATGYGYVEDGEIPAGATAITKAQYDALVAATQADQDQAAAAELAAARARWTQVRNDLVASGVTDATARILAGAVGIEPEGA